MCHSTRPAAAATRHSAGRPIFADAVSLAWRHAGSLLKRLGVRTQCRDPSGFAALPGPLLSSVGKALGSASVHPASPLAQSHASSAGAVVGLPAYCSCLLCCVPPAAACCLVHALACWSRWAAVQPEGRGVLRALWSGCFSLDVLPPPSMCRLLEPPPHPTLPVLPSQDLCRHSAGLPNGC